MAAFDLIVIGAGPAGYVGAIRAAQLGMNVALVEREFLGGTCLNIGCIPSKALLDSTHEYHRAKHRFAERGIKLGEISIDLPTLMSFKDKIVRQLTGGVGALIKKNKITHIKGSARLLTAGAIEVTGQDGKQTLEGDRILIATGSRPIDLAAAPLDGTHIVDSTGALAFSAVPQKLLVIGAGAIGLELGSVWSRLGSEVTFVEFLDHVAGNSDAEMARALQKQLEKQGMKFRLSSKVTAASREGEHVIVTIEASGKTEQITVDRVLVSVGRKPAKEGMGLEEMGVKLTERGMIAVGEHYATSVPGVFAVGDCIGGLMLAHKASDEAVACIERIAGVGGHVNYDAIPNVIYTAPELATVGLSEEQALAQGHHVKIGKAAFAANGRAKCMDDTDGTVKIIADADTDRVLGISILHGRASELIAEAVTAMEYVAASEDIARSGHAHPTLAEVIKEAALAVAGRAIHA